MGLVTLTWEGDATMPLSRKPCYIFYMLVDVYLELIKPVLPNVYANTSATRHKLDSQKIIMMLISHSAEFAGENLQLVCCRSS